MPSFSARPMYTAAIIERADNHLLIALPAPAASARQWIFPRGQADLKESAEAAMRRIAQEQLGLYVELVIGQPPFLVEIDGRPCEMRYFFCGIAGGNVSPGPYSEIRWISRTHLREYEFDIPSIPVVEWLLAS